ncbi:MAG: hypothetical protein ILA29_03175 [Prevotella sp.]|nr:hypothetical protein [Prevotella sp.]
MKKRVSGTSNSPNYCNYLSELKSYFNNEVFVDRLEEMCKDTNYILGVEEINGKLYWAFKKRSKNNNSERDTFITSLLNQIIVDFINMYEGGISGTSSNSASIELYNAFAKYDEWPGGYVQGYGYVGRESLNSFTYGQPMIMGTSWVYKGYSGVPVTEGKFYELALSSQWNGGEVDNYGYVGEYQQVLGSTGIDQLVQVSSSYRTIGAIVNASLMLRQEISQSQVYNSMGGTTISDDGLQQLLVSIFQLGGPAFYDDIEDALNEQCVIIVRVNMNSYITNTPNHVGDGDYNVVDYNPVKHRYVCFDSVSKQIKVLDKDLVDNGTISARFYIMNRV